MAYAEKTSVSVVKTKADIEELIQKAGADRYDLSCHYRISKTRHSGIHRNGELKEQKSKRMKRGSRHVGANGERYILSSRQNWKL